MSEYTPTIAPLTDGAAAPPETTPDAPEPAPITEQEVGEYREQDRFLPVSRITPPSSHIRLTPPFTPASLGLVTDVPVVRLQMSQGS